MVYQLLLQSLLLVQVANWCVDYEPHGYATIYDDMDVDESSSDGVKFVYTDEKFLFQTLDQATIGKVEQSGSGGGRR
ncbi:hypothetical protein L1049_008111 [Liquidambar formosana]|uniref:Uncharacterized protein n=1 Tax=Liquidambar formosana TaxID=63359 RepID=A0AAP0S5L5_LIQFO